MKRCGLWAVSLAVCSNLAAAGTAYSVSVDPDDWSFRTLGAGEVQSTVVPPGKNAKCPKGRFLVSHDGERPYWNDRYLIRGKDLDSDKLTVAQITNVGAAANNYLYVTNDHELVTLPNGNVLYITGAASRRVPTTKPAWWDYVYRGDFGPGARAVVMTWLSTDCGESFTYRGEFDPLESSDPGCANPQGSNTGTAAAPRYDMGGCDGQTVSVDPVSGDLYLTFSCVGFTTDPGAKPFGLTGTHLGRTLVARSTDQGQSWTALGAIPVERWRSEAVPLRKVDVMGKSTVTGLAVEVGTGVMIGALTPAAITFPGTFTSVIADEWFTGNGGVPTTQIYANIHAQPILTDGPQANTLILAVPDSIPGPAPAKVPQHGYQVYSLSVSGQKVTGKTTLDPVVPQGLDANNLALHLTAATTGGATLLYWADIDAKAMTATVRGRVLFADGSESKDFAISAQGGAPRSFALSPYKMCDTANTCWYGDYWTASGFTTSSKTVTSTTTTHTFAPVWVDPTTGRTSFNVVRVVAKTTPTLAGPDLVLGPGFKNLELIPIKKLGPPPVELRVDALRSNRVLQEVKALRLETKKPEVEVRQRGR